MQGDSEGHDSGGKVENSESDQMIESPNDGGTNQGNSKDGLEGGPQRHDLRDNAENSERDQEMKSQNDEGRNPKWVGEGSTKYDLRDNVENS